MENKIQTSMDWAQVQTAIEAPVYRMKKYNADMFKMAKNIGYLIKELSKEEINCRRTGRQTRQHKQMVDKINEEIANYERMLTFAVLLGA